MLYFSEIVKIVCIHVVLNSRNIVKNTKFTFSNLSQVQKSSLRVCVSVIFMYVCLYDRIENIFIVKSIK